MPYTEWLLSRLPERVGCVLDLGCGCGELCRLIAPRAERVIGVDVSGAMIGRAQERCADAKNVEFVAGDMMDLQLPAGGCDAIVSMAALHHVDLAAVLSRARGWLGAGGLMLNVDLRASEGATDRLIDFIGAGGAGARAALQRLSRDARSEACDAWRAHLGHDCYLTVSEVRRICEKQLPGADVRWRLRWRYTLEWRERGCV